MDDAVLVEDEDAYLRPETYWLKHYFLEINFM